MKFADRLKKERKLLGLTQAEVANLLEVSFEVISKWERQLSEPSKITQEGAISRLKLEGLKRK